MRNLRGARLHERNEKISKKLKFPLDKLKKVCYNKGTTKGDELPILKLKGRNLIARKRYNMMTTREFLNTIIEANLSEEATEKATALLAQIDKRNEKRASTPSKTAVANAPVKASIVAMLGSEPKTAAEVGAALEITTQKASALLRQLVEDGTIVASEVKIPKKGKVKGYTLAVVE